MAVTKDQFRQLMGCFATGVAVVTAVEPGGQPRGLTVNALSSVSMEPTLLLICIAHNSDTFEAIREGKAFAVNFLTSAQEEISRLFATKGTEKFRDLPYRRGELGMPLLEGTLAQAECRVVAGFPSGDHTIFVGEVENSRVTGGDPLLFFRGHYFFPAGGGPRTDQGAPA